MAATFQFGPALAIALSQIDFESVAVHELGHAQQLSHLILPGAVMHYAVARGQNTRAAQPAQRRGRRAGRCCACAASATWAAAARRCCPPRSPASAASYAAGSGATLSWTTRDECFLSGFVVERSAGRRYHRAGQPLATVAPRPPAGQYQFVDAQPPAGLHYYRLRLLRPDGSLDNAAPVVVSTDGCQRQHLPQPRGRRPAAPAVPRRRRWPGGFPRV